MPDNAGMERVLETQTIEGEIGLVIEYKAGRVLAVDVLQAAMRMVESLDRLDAALLSSVDTSLQPVSVLNDVQHSSLKMMLARALRNVPDDDLNNIDWKHWIGSLLVKGKYTLLQLVDADAPQIQHALDDLAPEYKRAPALAGYSPPRVANVIDALDHVATSRALLPGQQVKVQTELGDVVIPETTLKADASATDVAGRTVTNYGTEYFKVKFPDMLGAAQWTVLRNGRSTKVDMLHQAWLDAYHRREHSVLPGDSLKCTYEETVTYDADGNEIERKLAVTEVLEVITPPEQQPLL